MAAERQLVGGHLHQVYRGDFSIDVLDGVFGCFRKFLFLLFIFLSFLFIKSFIAGVSDFLKDQWEMGFHADDSNICLVLCSVRFKYLYTRMH